MLKKKPALYKGKTVVKIENWKVVYETLMGEIMGEPFTIPGIKSVYEVPKEGMILEGDHRAYLLGVPKK